MSMFIGIGIFLALVIGFYFWSARRTYKPEGSSIDMSKGRRQARLKAKEDLSKWSAGG